MGGKTKFAALDAMKVAEALISEMAQACERICFAGSLRRQKPEVGDVELLYIPRIEETPDPDSLLGETIQANRADEAICQLERNGTLRRRLNSIGSETFGPKIKLMLHSASDIPIDFFATTAPSWFNYLVCRTGPAELNVRICNAAIARGWKWEPYSPGFRRIGFTQPMASEREVFEFVGLPFRAPQDRHG